MTDAPDISPVLVSDRLRLVPLAEGDLAELAAAMTDPLIWEQHPAKDRGEPEAAARYARFLLDAGGTLVARDAAGRVIGCSRFYPVPDQPGDWGIGFTFLVRACWGGAWNRGMKALMLGHLFRTQPRAWFHIAPDNLRSQIATTRLGAVWRYDATLDLGAGPAPLKCYEMTPETWVGG